MTVTEASVVVIGGGVIGLSCALYLLRAGRSVRVLERGEVGGATSHGNCGTLTPSHAPPLASPASLAKGLKWMLRPDAPLYIRPRFDPALAAWLLHFASRRRGQVLAIAVDRLPEQRDHLRAVLDHPARFAHEIFDRPALHAAGRRGGRHRGATRPGPRRARRRRTRRRCAAGRRRRPGR